MRQPIKASVTHLTLLLGVQMEKRQIGLKTVRISLNLSHVPSSDKNISKMAAYLCILYRNLLGFAHAQLSSTSVSPGRAWVWPARRPRPPPPPENTYRSPATRVHIDKDILVVRERIAIFLLYRYCIDLWRSYSNVDSCLEDYELSLPLRTKILYVYGRLKRWAPKSLIKHICTLGS